MTSIKNKLDDGTRRLKRNSLEKKYYNLREKFYYEARRYYQQSPYGTYVNESNLIDKLNELMDMRAKLKALDEEFKESSIYDEDLFDSNNWLFENNNEVFTT